MTFSIIGIDKKKKELGVATRTKMVAVGNSVPNAEYHAGGIATQHDSNVSYRSAAMPLLKKFAPDEVIRRLMLGDRHKELRQVIVMNSRGDSAGYTGAATSRWAGHITGVGYICAGNCLVGEGVLAKMAKEFERSDDPLAERLIKCLAAGERAGGDWRKEKVGSAALLVVKNKHGLYGVGDRYIDLRIDMGVYPIKDISNLLKARRNGEEWYSYRKECSP